MKIQTATKYYSPVRAWARMTVFLLKLFPMLPSRPVNWITPKPLVEKVTYPTLHGYATGDLYRPPGRGPHRAVVVILGVVPFGTDHPQVPRLGEALARSGFAALLYWSPAMRDLRLEPDDAENIALAYEWLISQPNVDSTRSGLLGTCVGGSFALMAAASSRIRDRVSFIAAYAPYSSLFTLLQDAASSSTVREEQRQPWEVDQLTRKVLVRSLTSDLEPDEAGILRDAFTVPEHEPDRNKLSQAGKNICSLLSHPDAEEAQKIIERLPDILRARLAAMSPVRYLKDIQTPLIILLHDRYDQVIPVGESRRLRSELASHEGLVYKELQFQHLDPSRLPLFRLFLELSRFCKAICPLFYSGYSTGKDIKPVKHAEHKKYRPAKFYSF